MMHQAQQRQILCCPGCSVDLVVDFFEIHIQVQHIVGKGDLGGSPPLENLRLLEYIHQAQTHN